MIYLRPLSLERYGSRCNFEDNRTMRALRLADRLPETIKMKPVFNRVGPIQAAFGLEDLSFDLLSFYGIDYRKQEIDTKKLRTALMQEEHLFSRISLRGKEEGPDNIFNAIVSRLGLDNEEYGLFTIDERVLEGVKPLKNKLNREQLSLLAQYLLAARPCHDTLFSIVQRFPINSEDAAAVVISMAETMEVKEGDKKFFYQEGAKKFAWMTADKDRSGYITEVIKRVYSDRPHDAGEFAGMDIIESEHYPNEPWEDRFDRAIGIAKSLYLEDDLVSMGRFFGGVVDECFGCYERERNAGSNMLSWVMEKILNNDLSATGRFLVNFLETESDVIDKKNGGDQYEPEISGLAYKALKMAKSIILDLAGERVLHGFNYAIGPERAGMLIGAIADELGIEGEPSEHWDRWSVIAHGQRYSDTPNDEKFWVAVYAEIGKS